jgi:hypothetical protein
MKKIEELNPVPPTAGAQSGVQKGPRQRRIIELVLVGLVIAYYAWAHLDRYPPVRFYTSVLFTRLIWSLKNRISILRTVRRKLIGISALKTKTPYALPSGESEPLYSNC